MLLVSPFALEVTGWLRGEGYKSRALHVEGAAHLYLVRRASTSPSPSLLLHLLSSPRTREALVPRTSDLSDTFAGNRRRLVHLWEDQWDEHSSIVRSRLLTMLGRSRRIFARKCDARRIDSATLEAFLQRNHLWSATKARYRYGLYDRDEKVLVAVASFSPRWKLRRDGQTRASHELIRYCSRRGETVVGGITKLLTAFRREAGPDEIVTVIDRDWGDGGGWRSLGFKPLRRLPPVTFYVGPDNRRCHPGTGPNQHRRRLPAALIAQVQQLQQGDDGGDEEETRCNVEAFLASRGYFPVRDAGAERHLLVLTPYADGPND